MTKMIHINFLHQYGDEFQTNIGPCKIKREWLDVMKTDMYRHKVFLEMHTWYPKIRKDIWQRQIESGEILNDVVNYSNPGHYVAPIIYTDNTGINVLLDDKNKYIKHDLFVDLLQNNNKLFATFLLKSNDDRTEVIGIDRICLCLGMIDNKILFV